MGLKTAKTAVLLMMTVFLAITTAQHEKSIQPLHKTKHGRKLRNGLVAYSANVTGSFQIWVSTPDGSQPRQLTFPEQGIQLAAHPAFSPDGSRLAFTGESADGSFNVWVLQLAGTTGGASAGQLMQLTNSVSPIQSLVPAWSADGRRVIFESNQAVPPAQSTASDPYDLYSVDAATGGSLLRLTTTSAGRTSMGGKPSPDGRYLAFASDRDERMPLGLYDLYVVRLDSNGATVGAPRRLTRGAANQYSRSWSPDSSELAFNSQVGWIKDKLGAGRIMTVKVDGRNLRPLTQTNDRFPGLSPGGIFPTLRGDVTPAWSPDGTRIAFASQSDPNGSFQVVSVSAKSGKEHQVMITNAPSVEHVTVGWQPVLPN